MTFWIWTLLCNFNKRWDILSNFVAFWQYLNFNLGTPRPVSLQNQQRQASRREAKSGWHNWRVRYARDEKCKNSCILCMKPIANYGLSRDLPWAIWYTFEWSQEHYTMIRFLACVTFIFGKYDKTSWRLLNICLIRNHIFSKFSISWFDGRSCLSTK